MSTKKTALKRRVAGVAAVGAALLGTTVLTAAPAQAAGSWHCKNIGAGDLCIRTVSNGWDAKYAKYSGTPANVDFNLTCTGSKDGTWGDGGAFWISPGETKTYTFSLGRDPYDINTTCMVVLIDLNSRGRWYTDWV
ncbi:hypothetical protein ACIGFK_12140 [Streptomyces sp. NPDC085524]|uniref:hypothetical protein n=1 Tax=unclassified Streptomyces TaxID=2593676 RepID=UPI0035DDE80D